MSRRDLGPEGGVPGEGQEVDVEEPNQTGQSDEEGGRGSGLLLDLPWKCTMGEGSRACL